MKTIKGPGIFLAQFMGDKAPFNALPTICNWAAELGFKGVQLPTWDPRIIDLETAAESQDYCDDLRGRVEEWGLTITELSTHLQGQLIAVHPAYDSMFDNFAPPELHGLPKERTKWAEQQLKYAAKACQRMGITAQATFSGALLWPYWHPWPQQPAGLLDEGFNELARRWKPILDYFDECGVDACYEIHPGEDLHDGVTYELFLEKLNNHTRACLLYDPSHFVLQQLDYISYIDHYHERIKAFHVKDAEFRPNGKQGAFGGYQNWANRAGRYRSLGDGQVDFKRIFSKLTQYGFDGWAVMEWECVLKHPEDGAREGAAFIADHIIRVTEKAFDDFAGGKADEAFNKRVLGLQ